MEVTDEELADALRSDIGSESPFNEPEDEAEDVVEETEEETEEESDAVEDDESGEGEEEDDDESDDGKLAEVNENLKRALNEERGMRKSAQEERDSLNSEIESLRSEAEDLQSIVESYAKQIEELDLADVIKVEGKTDPKLRELEKEKAAREQEEASRESIEKFNAEMVSQATAIAPDYKNVDIQNDEQGAALQQMIYVSAMNGMSMEDSVKSAFERLNSILDSALKKRPAPVKPKRKPKAVAKTVKTKQPSVADRIAAITDGWAEK